MAGNMSSTDFDNWLFGADTKVGSYTKSPIKMSDGSYMVAFFVAEGEPATTTKPCAFIISSISTTASS